MLYPAKKIQSLSKQSGAAIIIALFIVALVAAIATAMVTRLRVDARRTELIITSNTAILLAQGSVNWAIDQLINDWKQQQPNKIIDKTPIESGVQHQSGATISSVIYDAQGYFNVNNLTDPQYQTNFTRLIQVVAPDMDSNNAQNISLAVMDWISLTSKNPGFDDYYLKLNPAYVVPHRPMTSISELRLVKGMTGELFNKLLPYVIALPKTTSISVNNTFEPVLMSLSMTLSAEGAKTIVKTAQQNPFANTQNFLNFDVVKNNPIDASKITVTSNYFLVKTNVTLGTQTVTLYTLLERAPQGNQSKINILWQSDAL